MRACVRSNEHASQCTNQLYDYCTEFYVGVQTLLYRITFVVLVYKGTVRDIRSSSYVHAEAFR
jgi:hypothetical protein